MNTPVYGPQYKRDNSFTRRMRFHQSWWRVHRLQEHYPQNDATHAFGNYLDDAAASRGRNFLTEPIADYAKQRIDNGGGVEQYRCTHNLLSSQPMAFNLFGPLHLDADLAVSLLDPLLPGGVLE